jgi:EAL domain-containing protein (putative c-di-GMP-specific phosphodiesterase class I)/GGDEF domain-containing protein
MSKERDREFLALRGKWQKERSRLYDRDSGLPTLAVLTEELGRELKARGSLAVLIFHPGSEGRVEQVWGWEAYDDLLLDFSRRLKGLQAEGVVPRGTICVPHVRSDEFLLVVEAGEGLLDQPGALEQKAREIDRLIRGYLGERADVRGRFRSFVEARRIAYDPKFRVERLIYRGIQEARDQDMHETVRSEVRGGQVLREAIARRETVPVFQPIFDLATGEIIGAEALSHGPRGSEIESGEILFSLAERTELLLPLERMCRQQLLEAAADTAPSRQIFLNLSPTAVSDPDFLGGKFLEQLAGVGLSPDGIVLEITERTYAIYEGLFREVLARFRQQGFLIAVDDVGTGYSNLTSLADIAPDYLKFDNVFVRGIDKHPAKQDLLEALLSFAQKMKAKVIGEGIETGEELDALRRLGVPYGQGYFLARPMPFDEIENVQKLPV